MGSIFSPLCVSVRLQLLITVTECDMICTNTKLSKRISFNANTADVSHSAVSRTAEGEVYLPHRRLAMKDRRRQRENRRLKHREEGLEKRNTYGVKDLTAYNAVQRIRLGRRAMVKLA